MPSSGGTLNADVQAVVIRIILVSAPQFDAPNLRIYLEQHLVTEPDSQPKDYGSRNLARAIAKTRPESER